MRLPAAFSLCHSAILVPAGFIDAAARKDVRFVPSEAHARPTLSPCYGHACRTVRIVFDAALPENAPRQAQRRIILQDRNRDAMATAPRPYWCLQDSRFSGVPSPQVSADILRLSPCCRTRPLSPETLRACAHSTARKVNAGTVQFYSAKPRPPCVQTSPLLPRNEGADQPVLKSRRLRYRRRRCSHTRHAPEMKTPVFRHGVT